MLRNLDEKSHSLAGYAYLGGDCLLCALLLQTASRTRKVDDRARLTWVCILLDPDVQSVWDRGHLA